MRDESDSKTQRLRFVGYGSSYGIKGYRLLDERRRKMMIRRDVTFDETNLGQQKETVSINETEDIVEVVEPVGEEVGKLSDSTTDSDNEDDTAEQEQKTPRRTARTTAGVVPKRFADEFAYHTGEVSEPATMQEAMNSERRQEWKEAADAEYKSLIENKTWKLMKIPKGRKAGFHVKYDKNGKIDRFKARLVAKGYSQKYGIDYDQTYSPVVRLTTIRVLLAWATCNKMKIHQMDVVTAFLNGNLEEEIYMQQPDGYVEAGQEDCVCLLEKSLYGLKQAPRCWNTKFVNHVRKMVFKQSEVESCMFVRSGKYKPCVLAVYVDDIIITKSKEEIEILSNRRYDSRLLNQITKQRKI